MEIAQQVPGLARNVRQGIRFFSLAVQFEAKTSLEDAPVRARGVEVQIQRISRKAQMYCVGSFDGDRAIVSRSDARDLDLLSCDRNIQLLGLLVNRVTDGVIALGAVGAHLRFSLDGVLELVVGEERRRQFGDQIHHCNNREYPKHHFSEPITRSASGRAP